MNKYTIYCTEEQTKKALELGAPICRIPIGGRDGSKPSYFTKQLDEEGWAECPAYYIPTADQMLGWLEEQGIVIIFMATIKDDESGYTWIAHICHFQDKGFWIDAKNLSRKEATLAAIDAALDYLINNK